MHWGKAIISGPKAIVIDYLDSSVSKKPKKGAQIEPRSNLVESIYYHVADIDNYQKSWER
jgi:hypothetical protein